MALTPDGPGEVHSWEIDPAVQSIALAGIPAAFVDKDGTLIRDLPYNVDPDRVRFMPHALDGLRMLAFHGFRIVVVTNQPGVALGLFDLAALRRLELALRRMLHGEGIELTGFHACPHAAATARRAGCRCRKPAAGLLRQAARLHGLDLARSWMIGDILDDVEAGHRAGCRSVLLDVGNETQWRVDAMRMPDLRAVDLLDAAQRILAHRGGRMSEQQCTSTGWVA